MPSFGSSVERAADEALGLVELLAHLGERVAEVVERRGVAAG